MSMYKQMKINQPQQLAWKAALTGLTLLLAALVFLGPLASVALAGQNKVAVCHLNGNGTFVPITIADPALDSHLAHGDLVVDVDVDENCEPLALDADGDGVSDAEDNCLDIANPNQEDRYGSAAGDACEDLDDDGTFDVNEANFCLSIDGVLLESRGTAECESTLTTGTGPNVAAADGDGAEAFAIEGDNNSATATGNNVFAAAGFGNNNSATATGDGAYAVASVGDNNSATATGDGAQAVAQRGDNNSATATGDGTYAVAAGGDTNSATSTGVFTCAGGGDSNETAVDQNLCY